MVLFPGTRKTVGLEESPDFLDALNTMSATFCRAPDFSSLCFSLYNKVFILRFPVSAGGPRHFLPPFMDFWPGGWQAFIPLAFPL